MNKISIGLLFWLLFFCWTCRISVAQDTEYKLNPRTGRFDMVRSSEWLSENAGSAFDGNRQITRTGIPGVTPGGTTVAEFLENFFYPKRNPTATIATATTTREYMSAGADLPITLNFTAGRPATCPEITAVTVAGAAQSIPAIAEGDTYAGAFNGTLPRNVDKTFTVNVQAGAGAASASVAVVWRRKRYRGTVASDIPPSDPSFSVTGERILGLAEGEFATARQKVFAVNPAGNYIMYAYPKAWGVPNLYVNGFAFNDYTVREISFTNASGGAADYYAVILNQKYYSSVDIDVR
jgi:hypothetical protein